MADTGTIILKRGTNMPYDNAQDDTAGDTGTKVLLKGEPGAQIVGLSQFNRSGAGILGVAQYNYPNRLWCGMDGYGDETASAPSRETDASFDNVTYANVYPYTGSVIENVDYTRPLWMGAEIRAYEPLKEDGGTAGDYVILKADWNKPSDFVLVTQKAISAMPLRVYERKPDPTDTVPPDAAGVTANREFVEFGVWTNTGTGGSNHLSTTFNNSFANKVTASIKYCFPDQNGADNGDGTQPSSWIPGNSYTGSPHYLLCSREVFAASDGNPPTVQLGFIASVNAFNAYLADSAGAKVALLGADGATKGKQTFLSPIGVESYVEILPYNIGATQYPATITSALEGAASIFDTNIIDLSMGGAAELIEIGDGSTNGNTATTIYGQLTVTGSTILSADTMIDGGTF